MRVFISNMKIKPIFTFSHLKMADFDFVLKIIILGDNRVGKSSFILKYSQNIFSD